MPRRNRKARRRRATPPPSLSTRVADGITRALVALRDENPDHPRYTARSTRP